MFANEPTKLKLNAEKDFLILLPLAKALSSNFVAASGDL